MIYIEENIYVVGYPKSGNTWLTRLLARCLKISVADKAMDDRTVEIASDINKDIELTNCSAKILKIHYLPAQFTDKIDKNPKYIVYLYRDIRDVLVSSFFYYKYHGERRYALNKFLPEYFINPISIMRWVKTRYEFNKFVSLFIEKGLGKFGVWNQHVSQWRKYLYENKQLYHCIVSYEDLLFNTEKELKRIIRELDLAFDDYNHMKKCIIEESFQIRKNKLLNAEEHSVTFGKKFNVRFLRKGEHGDWKHFLTTNQLYNINKTMNINANNKS